MQLTGSHLVATSCESFSYAVGASFDIAQRDEAPANVIRTPRATFDAEMRDSVTQRYGY